MVDARMTDRPRLTWVLVPTAAGARLEMRWGVVEAAPATTHAA